MVARLLTSAHEQLAERAHHVTGESTDYDELLRLIGDRRVVLIGEASHGTHEFYRERAKITRRLIDECGFNVVTLEADFPDAHRVHRYVTGASDDAGASTALGDFRRFPAWMWRNRDVVDFVSWLRARNDAHCDEATKVRIYGLDLYSLKPSIGAVIGYLDRVDPAEAARARQRYGCFDHIDADGQAYGFALAFTKGRRCEDEVVDQLRAIRQRAARARDVTPSDADERFVAEQNARLVHDAEEYYRQMYREEVSSWNLRDRHMVGTLDAVVEHMKRQFGLAKVVVWAHNSHVGDARATMMGIRGEFNIGQLARQRDPADCFLIGMTTYDGSVTAASNWGEPPQRRWVRPALPGSHEALLHDLAIPNFWLSTSDPAVRDVLSETRLERAIGVIYRPQTERASHYFGANLANQFDAVIHIDHSRALEPLDRGALWDHAEPPETFPSGY
jgi:erythromycin esterase-like protein